MSSHGRTLAGTGVLVRFVLRRDRWRLPIWVVGLSLLVWTTAASVEGLYPTRAELDAAAAPMRDNAAVVALNGPTYGIDTLGGQIVFQVGSFGYVAMALMGMFLVGRHTRADEENGRTELLRATVVGRHAPVTAVLLVAAAAFATLGSLITAILLGQGLAVTGSVVFGAAMGGFGLLFACVTAVTAQISEHARTALGLAGVLLGVSYVVRAVGDVGSGTLSWLSPMGWAQASRPFADERPWTLLLLLAGAGLLAAVAYALQSRRDVGAGLVAPRPGPATAPERLGRPEGLALRLQRASVVAWLAGVVLTGVAYGSITGDLEDLIGDSDAMRDIIAQAGGDLLESFFTTSLLVLALITGGFAVSSTLRLRSEETAGRAEPVLATAVSRSRWAASHLAIALGGSALIMVSAALVLAITDAIVRADTADAVGVVAGAVTFAPALWVLVGLTFALYGLRPGLTPLAWAALVGFVVIGFFGQLLDLPPWVLDLSPFEQVPGVPAEDFRVAPVLALLAVTAALIAAGFAGIRRRDLDA